MLSGKTEERKSAVWEGEEGYEGGFSGLMVIFERKHCTLGFI